MRHLRIALPLLLSLAFAACNNNDPECIDFVPSCDINEPVDGTLRIQVTRNNANASIPIAVYYGYIDDSSLYFRDTLTTPEIAYAVPFGRYSVSAAYQQGADRITAIDGDRVRYKTNTECDYTCYTLVDGDIDLRLK
jgi:hypothetical protein